MSETSALEQRLGFIRRLTLTALIAVAVGIAVRLSFIDGWLRRVSIDGESMAPAFQGDHWEATCADCGYLREVAADQLPVRGDFVCPNCGSRREPTVVTPQRADRVLVDRWPLLWREPRRWETVATVGDKERLVKRVVALPGEQLELRGGDVWINRQPIERSETLQHFQSLVVNDDAFRSASAERRRWRAEKGWSETADGYRFSSSLGKDDERELVYHHLRVDNKPSAILDDDPYNANKKRNLQEVRDIGMTFRLTKSPTADVTFALHDGAAWCYARWTAADHRWRLLREAQMLTQRSEEPDELERSFEFSRCDGRLRLFINGVVFMESLLPPNSEACDYSTEPLRIGAARGDVQVRDLVVRRNIFYLNPENGGGDWEAPRKLGPDEFALLGDNSPASVDSRQFAEYGVRRERLIGVVIPWNRRLAR